MAFKNSAVSGVFRSMVVVTFQSVFHSEMYQNNILKKIIFDISTSK
jgi:hypothetical protein